MNDKELLDCFLSGDKECFGIVYERFRKPFIQTAMHSYSLVREDAEDIVQDFFLKSFETFDKYDSDKGTIKDYMEVSFKNFVIDFIRKERRKGFQEEIEDYHMIDDGLDEIVEYKTVLNKYIHEVIKDESSRIIFEKYLSGVDMRDLYIEYENIMPPFKIKNLITRSLVAVKRYASKKQA